MLLEFRHRLSRLHVPHRDHALVVAAGDVIAHVFVEAQARQLRSRGDGLRGFRARALRRPPRPARLTEIEKLNALRHPRGGKERPVHVELDGRDDRPARPDAHGVRVSQLTHDAKPIVLRRAVRASAKISRGRAPPPPPQPPNPPAATVALSSAFGADRRVQTLKIAEVLENPAAFLLGERQRGEGRLGRRGIRRSPAQTRTRIPTPRWSQARSRTRRGFRRPR